MDSNASANPRNRAKNRVFPRGFDIGKSHSFSSSSSSNSSSSSSSRYFDTDDPTLRSSPLSPSTPMRFSSGVPFSWEKLPGIPKRQTSSGKRPSDNAAAASLKLSSLLLPLPPSITTRKNANPAGEIGGSFRKKGTAGQWDPFVAALVECSKDDDSSRQHDHLDEAAGSLWTGAKVSRSISDRFGFIGLYGSCKRTCAVDESIIYVPRPGRMTAPTSYGLIRYHHRTSTDK